MSFSGLFLISQLLSSAHAEATGACNDALAQSQVRKCSLAILMPISVIPADPAKLSQLQIELQAAFSDLEPGFVSLMSNEQQQMRLEAQDIDLASCGEMCAAESGKALQVDYIIEPKLTIIKNQNKLTLTMTSIYDEQIVKTSQFSANSMDDLILETKSQGARFLGDSFEKQGLSYTKSSELSFKDVDVNQKKFDELMKLQEKEEQELLAQAEEKRKMREKVAQARKKKEEEKCLLLESELSKKFKTGDAYKKKPEVYEKFLTEFISSADLRMTETVNGVENSWMCESSTINLAKSERRKLQSTFEGFNINEILITGGNISYRSQSHGDQLSTKTFTIEIDPFYITDKEVSHQFFYEVSGTNSDLYEWSGIGGKPIPASYDYAMLLDHDENQYIFQFLNDLSKKDKLSPCYAKKRTKYGDTYFSKKDSCDGYRLPTWAEIKHIESLLIEQGDKQTVYGCMDGQECIGKVTSTVNSNTLGLTHFKGNACEAFEGHPENAIAHAVFDYSSGSTKRFVDNLLNRSDVRSNTFQEREVKELITNKWSEYSAPLTSSSFKGISNSCWSSNFISRDKICKSNRYGDNCSKYDGNHAVGIRVVRSPSSQEISSYYRLIEEEKQNTREEFARVQSAHRSYNKSIEQQHADMIAKATSIRKDKQSEFDNYLSSIETHVSELLIKANKNSSDFDEILEIQKTLQKTKDEIFDKASWKIDDASLKSIPDSYLSGYFEQNLTQKIDEAMIEVNSSMGKKVRMKPYIGVRGGAGYGGYAGSTLINGELLYNSSQYRRDISIGYATFDYVDYWDDIRSVIGVPYISYELMPQISGSQGKFDLDITLDTGVAMAHPTYNGALIGTTIGVEYKVLSLRLKSYTDTYRSYFQIGLNVLLGAKI